MTYTIGIDIGGTFTDIVVSSKNGRIIIAKAATIAKDQSDGVLEGLTLAAEPTILILTFYGAAVDWLWRVKPGIAANCW